MPPPPPHKQRRRRVCFVSGTRAEFGLMRSTLEAICAHRKLQLQLVATGMHLDPTRGGGVDQIRADGWTIDRVVPWPAPATQVESAVGTGEAMAALARAISDLKTQIVLVVGDRVEAFAAAAAGHLSGCVVAHVHGGDRALGQVDDSLRHAITKLAHVHFPATSRSAGRVARLGEDGWRIHRVGSPGLDDVRAHIVPRKGHTALVVLHPVDADESVEFERARTVLRAVSSFPFDRVAIVYPNTDPGAAGIVRCWHRHATGARFELFPDLPRPQFLGLLRGATMLVGNSSSGIIEAASFGTPVIDVGPRQLGRERSKNVTSVPYSEAAIQRALARIWNDGRPKLFRGRNVYGGGGAGRRIAEVLARLDLHDPRLRRKLIAY
jgi:UDP-N-acetylglucosamine 2-epimerase (non-hydrolysing)/GDP/UDP-N,N'-diacetylbacillosamine 2-epimerase (hydrolysing)